MNALQSAAHLTALAIQADAECALCRAVVDWLGSHGAHRLSARRRAATAVLAARMARGAVAQARRELQLVQGWGNN
jgi:hypothetical protein